MKLQTTIQGVNAEADPQKLVISAKKPLKVLSSAYHNGGLVEVTSLVNFHISKEQDERVHSNPDSALKKAIMKLGLSPRKTVAMMTAAEMRNLGMSRRKHQSVRLNVFTTAGVDVGATAGETTVSEQNATLLKLGTINIILIIDGNLTDCCMVDAAKTITEAKSVVLKELDVRSRFSGDLASGTVTDTVAVACTGRGKPVKFAGTGTLLGELIGRMVKESLKEALEKQQGIVAGRPLTQRLRERGIVIADLAKLLLDTEPKKRGNLIESKEFIDRLEKTLDDCNVSQFVFAALRIDEDIKAGLIPSVASDRIQIAEVLQAAVGSYLGEKKRVRCEVMYDKNPGLASKLGPVTRSVLSSIITAIYADMYD
jgi:iron complex transport system ATP-binding protein